MIKYAQYVDLRDIFGSVHFDDTADGGQEAWIDLMKVGDYKHPLYGDIALTSQKLKQFADNVNSHVRGIDLNVDYDHGSSKSNTEAAGWITKARVMGDTLQGLVKFTASAVKKIKEGAYRYFSPEYHDEWTDSSGTTYKNVLFGGGLTNRPFLKDLMPINLSELTFLVPSATPPTKEDEVDPKQLRARVGLAEDATDAELEAKLELIKQLSEVFPNGVPTPPPAPPVVKPDPIPLPQELRALAETNPTARALISHLEDQTTRLHEMQVQLREAGVARRLSEFDTSKIALTPVARDKATKLLSDPRLPDETVDQIYELMTMMRDGNTFVVELGERTAGYSRRTGEKSAEKLFGEMTEALMTKGVSYPDAIEQVAKENPGLYERYRVEATSFVE
jgi:Mu-like prophage I protein